MTRPGNEAGPRRESEGTADTIAGGDYLSVNARSDLPGMTPEQDVIISAAWQALAVCPADALPWAALGYRVGVADGRQEERAQAVEDVRAIARAAAPLWKVPRHDDVRKLREPDYSPCPARCQHCSRCVHYESWYRLGKRQFRGVEAEQGTAANDVRRAS